MAFADFTSVEEVITGIKRCRFGMSKSKGTSGSGAFLNGVAGIVGLWDATDTKAMIKGGYDLNGTTQYLSRTSGTVPCCSSGAPQYPFSVVSWFLTDSTAANDFQIWNLVDGSAMTNRIQLQTFSTSFRVYRASGATNQTTSLTGVTAGRWHCVIMVLTAANGLELYADTNTTGTTGTTTVSVSGLDEIYMGSNTTPGQFFNGRIAYTAVLPVALSSTQRTEIFAGADPALVAGFSAPSVIRASDGAAGAIWKFDNDIGVDSSGNDFTMTAFNTPTAQNNALILRDKGGTKAHLLGVTGTTVPAWNAANFNAQGGVTFTRASSQLLRRNAAPPVTAEPLQIYAVALVNNVTQDFGLFFLGDKDSNVEGWWLSCRGDSGGDPIIFYAYDSSSANANTSSGFSASTNFLAWASAASGTDRKVQINGGNEGTSVTDLTPDGADTTAFGCFGGATTGSFLDGQLGFVVLLNTSSTLNKRALEKYIKAVFNITAIP